MNQRIFYLIALLIAIFMLTNTKPIPTNIHRIEGINKLVAQFQTRRTVEKANDVPSIYSDLNLVPDIYDQKCYSQWDHWTSNGLAERLGNPIGWKRIAQWNNECEPETISLNFSDVYSIILSNNPMIAYPEFSDYDKQLLTESGLIVSIKKMEYPYTLAERTIVYMRVMYMFEVQNVYVYVDQIMLRESTNDDEILNWADQLYNEIQTSLVNIPS